MINQAVKTIYIDFLVDNVTGWGIYARNLIKYAAYQGVQVIAINGESLQLETLPFFDHQLYRKFKQDSKIITDRIQAGEIINDPNAVLLSHMNWGVEGFITGYDHLKIGRKIGIVFFTNPHEAVTHKDLVGNHFDAIICGSKWNYELLVRQGYKNPIYLIQGIDTDYYLPRIAPLPIRDKFYIYSGGKLETRKAQDFVLQSFALILAKIPNAQLVSSWFWPSEAESAKMMNGMGFSPHPWKFYHKPQGGEGVDLFATAKEYGIPASAIIQIPPRPNHMMANILNQMHCAIFPNRAEGGTNLVAMEAIACAIPSVISHNTGHLDLMEIAPYLKQLALYKKKEIKTSRPEDQLKFDTRYEGWGWHDESEACEKIEAIYHNYDEYRKLAYAAALKMVQFSWDNQINQLLTYINTGTPPNYVLNNGNG